MSNKSNVQTGAYRVVGPSIKLLPGGTTIDLPDGQTILLEGHTVINPIAVDVLFYDSNGNSQEADLGAIIDRMNYLHDTIVHLGRVTQSQMSCSEILDDIKTKLNRLTLMDIWRMEGWEAK